MRNLKKNSFKTKAYNEVKNMILLQDLPQGEKIFEKDLAEKLGMSRTPVREALLALAHEHLVENRERLGFIVRRLQSDEIYEYYNIRQVLEQYAAPLITEKISPREIEVLENNVAEAEACLASGDFRRFVLCNSQFHKLLIKTAQSSPLFRALESLDDIATLLRAMASRKRSGISEAMQGHKEIVSILKENKDSEQLKQSMVNHLNGSKRRNLALVELIA